MLTALTAALLSSVLIGSSPAFAEWYECASSTEACGKGGGRILPGGDVYVANDPCLIRSPGAAQLHSPAAMRWDLFAGGRVIC